MTIKNRIARFVALGFDASTQVGRYVRIRCSQCAAARINGIACHEAGCPHETRPCGECGSPAKRGHWLCADCEGDR